MEVLFPIGTLVLNKKTKQIGRVIDNFVDTTDPNDVYLGSYVQLDSTKVIDIRDASEWMVIPDVTESIAATILNYVNK